MTFSKEHRAKLHSADPIGRLDGGITRRTDVVRILANDNAVVRIVGALLLEQDDESAVQRTGYMTLETIARMNDDPLISLPAVTRRSSRPMPEPAAIGRHLHRSMGHGPGHTEETR